MRLDHLERVKEVATNNLECLKRTLEWNVEHDIFFFRISSNTIPFASHPKMTFNWREEMRGLLGEVGDVIRENSIRVSMHPGQYTVLNSEREEVVKSSIEELRYHADLLDLMGVEGNVQIHVGSSKGGKEGGTERFMENFSLLPENVKSRLVAENDDRVYKVKDCLEVWGRTGTPVVLDNLHHSLNNDGERLEEVLKEVRVT